MSQFFIETANGQPTVPTSFTTDSGTAVPVANNLNVFGGSTFSNDIDGLNTVGSGDTVTVQLTNRATATITTSDGLGQTRTLLTFAFSAPENVYNFDINIVGYRSSDSTGAGFKLFGTILSDGTTATIQAVPDKIANVPAALSGVDANFSASGANGILEVTGINATSIQWRAVATYVQVVV